jgi:hypothetical protein
MDRGNFLFLHYSGSKATFQNIVFLTRYMLMRKVQCFALFFILQIVSQYDMGQKENQAKC